jgi:hypothetical protein
MKKCIVAAIAALFMSVSAASVKADTIEFTDTIPVSNTTWSDSMSIPLFNPGLGTLQSIEFELKGTVQGTAQYESLDADAATITLNLQAQITLQRPDLSQLVVVIPVVNVVENATAFDGLIDFDGGSGSTFANLMGMATETSTSPPPASDLALFTGFGNIILPVTAQGISSGSGAGNLIQQFMTNAGAELKVKYTYVVPEPGSMIMLISGLAMSLSRRRLTIR